MKNEESNTTSFKVPQLKHKAIKRKPTPYHSKFTKKITHLTKTVLFSEDDGPDSPAHHKPSKRQKINSSSKKVQFSQTESAHKGKIERKATPYRLLKKTNDDSSKSSLKTVLFPVTTSDSDSEEESFKFEVTPVNSSSPSLSELASSSITTKSSTSLAVDEFNLGDLDVSFNNSVTLISDDDSDSGKSEELDVSKTDCENSVVCDNISLIVNTSSEQDLSDFDSKSEFEEDDDVAGISIQDGEWEDCLSSDENDECLEEPADGNDLSVDEIIEILDDEDCNTINDYRVLNSNGNSDSELVEELNLETVTINNIKFTILPQNLKTYIHGLVTATVLHGSVELLGYKLTSSSGPKNVYSPKASPFLYFETKKFIANTFDNTFIEFLKKLGMTEDPFVYLPIKTANCCIMLLEKLERVEISFMEKYIPQQLFPTVLNDEPRYKFLSKENNWNFLNVNPEWEILTNLMTSSDRLLISGGKGVGKSVMCRYVLNKLLMKHPKVLLVDLDPGQPEFTLSGCVSMNTVEEPIFGPNYTHLKKPLKCVFVPNINIFNSPHEYMNSVKMLLDETLPLIPTVINYMGYTRELGLELLSAVVAHSKPTLLTHICSENKQQNFSCPLSYDLMVEKAKLFAENQVFPEFTIKTLRSVADISQGRNLLPREIRELSALTYLGTMVSPDNLSLIYCSQNVYIINISSVKLLHNRDEVSSEVMNGNLVALCSNDNICYGWGVVRGINSSTEDLYIHTPLYLKEFAKVDCLILGSVMLPPSLYMSSSNKLIPNPYVCVNAKDLMGKVPKRTHFPGKSKLSKN